MVNTIQVGNKPFKANLIIFKWGWLGTYILFSIIVVASDDTYALVHPIQMNISDSVIIKIIAQYIIVVSILFFMKSPGGEHGYS